MLILAKAPSFYFFVGGMPKGMIQTSAAASHARFSYRRQPAGRRRQGVLPISLWTSESDHKKIASYRGWLGRAEWPCPVPTRNYWFRTAKEGRKDPFGMVLNAVISDTDLLRLWLATPINGVLSVMISASFVRSSLGALVYVGKWTMTVASIRSKISLGFGGRTPPL